MQCFNAVAVLCCFSNCEESLQGSESNQTRRTGETNWSFRTGKELSFASGLQVPDAIERGPKEWQATVA